MSGPKWQAADDLFREFQALGRASLASDIQDSHSGNMAVRRTGADGRDEIVITATGSQKGDLEPSQICFLSATETDYGYYKASSETDIHARILALPGVRASMHAHLKDLVLATLDDAPKPEKPPDFVPVDPLARRILGPAIPVDWFAVPSGSPELTRTIPERLAGHPLTVIFGHGAMAKGRSLREAFYRLSVGNYAGAVVRNLQRIRVDVEAIRRAMAADPAGTLAAPPPDYEIEGDDRSDFREEEEILREFVKAGHRIFESRLSPFHTGSMSVRGVASMLYAPKASMPRDVGGPLLSVPLAAGPGDDAEISLHKAIYAASDFQSVMHCHVAEAEASAYFAYPGETTPADRIIPIDAEGSFLYLVIPVLPPRVTAAALIRALHDYKVAVVRGGGVWAVGAQSLSEVLHHPSSVREVCHYRIGAVERGLDLRRMEPAKAKRW
ncbi:MAG TPA: class II aldolase/adducin family protein [Candidatus Aminicenantes bacterium]|nr:class II aldolase/adducin family protein [Candidatus Aminicenantes bacterium]HRY64696.1 class II aldolase/adducin family protein [Candidatus Aminicenantes bacterium]HRZ71609.1 class II aldolase/adducin family protein [Candidatus Aminicenantes bacterium]